jgi:hypothetical protein
MIMWLCKKAYVYILKKDPDDILAIKAKLAQGKDYHDLAIELCGREAIQGFLFMLAACYVHVTNVRSMKDIQNA